LHFHRDLHRQQGWRCVSGPGCGRLYSRIDSALGTAKEKNL